MAAAEGRSALAAQVARIEAALPPGLATRKRMFGGEVFMLAGNMLCHLSPKGLMVRVGAAAEAAAISLPHAEPCTETGRPMPGFVLVRPKGFQADADLGRWLDMARAYVETLPRKSERKSKPAAKPLSKPSAARRR